MAKTITPAKKDAANRPTFVFGKINFILMVVGMVLLAIGYVMMVGGHPDDPAVFNPEVKYSFTRITLAPMIVVLGLVIEVFAIMVNPRD